MFHDRSGTVVLPTYVLFVVLWISQAVSTKPEMMRLQKLEHIKEIAQIKSTGDVDNAWQKLRSAHGTSHINGPTDNMTLLLDEGFQEVSSANVGRIKLKDGLCLHSSEGKKAGKVQMWPCEDGNANQHWNFESSTGLIRHHKHTSFCLDSPYRSKNGGKVILWSCAAHNKNQIWEYQEPSGLFKLKHGFCLDSPGRKKHGIVYMWPCRSSNKNQQWKMEFDIHKCECKHGKGDHSCKAGGKACASCNEGYKLAGKSCSKESSARFGSTFLLPLLGLVVTLQMAAD
mmetsp:Transcript_59916/g.106574  ORF Transcript_59916/g.106574 Transcript_59916/m.106574 type:complete len:285 (+) Transcript_59916:52-906(+)